MFPSTTAKQLSHLPRLRDVLQRYRDSFLDIELKVKGLGENHARSVSPAQATAGIRRLGSFQPGSLKSVRALDPTIPLGLICESRTQLRLWNELPVEYYSST